MKSNQPFPPIRWLWRDYRRAAAWYAGDEKKLKREGGSFWQGDEEMKIHVPIAADIAAMSAAMVFSQSPEVRSGHAPTTRRIAEIFEKAGVYASLLMAAELASVYGGVFLKWSWNLEDGFPRLTALPPDSGLPVYKNGRLVEIKLWSVLREEGEAVYRLEERYTPDGAIRSCLYRGSKTELGRACSLNSIEEGRGIRPLSRSGAGVMLAAYVPNLLPGRKHPELPFGRSDFDCLYGLFDALDEAYSAIQRETRLTKTTVIVPAEYLRRRDALFTGDGPAWVYSNQSGVFTALDIDSDRASSPITVINPAPHASERIALCAELVRRILCLAGYAPQSAGLDISGNSESGTALTVRERKSIRTTEAKKTLWWQALNEMVRAMLRLDKAVFASAVDVDAQLSVELPALAQPDLAQLSDIVSRLMASGAMSPGTAVEMLHPDWSEEERRVETERLEGDCRADSIPS